MTSHTHVSANKLLTFIGCLLIISACGNNKKSQPQVPDADVEISTVSTELPNVIGIYKGTFGRLVLRQDQTYTASITQEIGFRTGPGSAPTRDYYAICSVTEFGKFELFKKINSKHIRFVASSADVISASRANRGSKDFDPKEICDLYAEARKSQPLSQKYELAASGVLALKYWPVIYSGTYKGEPSHFSELIDRPTPMGMLFSIQNKQIEVTAFMGKFLQAAFIPDNRLADGKWPSEDITFEPTSGRLTFVSNSCAFAVDFKASVTVTDGEFTIFPADIVSNRSIDTEASRFFAATRSAGIPKCQIDREEFAEAQLKRRGIGFRVLNWMTIELQSGSIIIQKQLPKMESKEHQ